ncbi:hypothetical protein BGAFAR04_0731 [Borreliella garinii Far04]|nr:hypothetical protein BGAFAR04_0731 [Borreliella garinii Far04]
MITLRSKSKEKIEKIFSNFLEAYYSMILKILAPPRHSVFL